MQEYSVYVIAAENVLCQKQPEASWLTVMPTVLVQAVASVSVQSVGP